MHIFAYLGIKKEDLAEAKAVAVRVTSMRVLVRKPESESLVFLPVPSLTAITHTICDQHSCCTWLGRNAANCRGPGLAGGGWWGSQQGSGGEVKLACRAGLPPPHQCRSGPLKPPAAN